MCFFNLRKVLVVIAVQRWAFAFCEGFLWGELLELEQLVIGLDSIGDWVVDGVDVSFYKTVIDVADCSGKLHPSCRRLLIPLTRKWRIEPDAGEESHIALWEVPNGSLGVLRSSWGVVVFVDIRIRGPAHVLLDPIVGEVWTKGKIRAASKGRKLKLIAPTRKHAHALHLLANMGHALPKYRTSKHTAFHREQNTVRWARRMEKVFDGCDVFEHLGVKGTYKKQHAAVTQDWSRSEIPQRKWSAGNLFAFGTLSVSQSNRREERGTGLRSAREIGRNLEELYVLPC
jgi:hypothetical protein